MAASATKKPLPGSFAFGATPAARRAAVASVLKDSKRDLRTLGETKVPEVAIIPTASTLLDIGLGVGGYPMQRVIEIFGDNGSGKTTLALHAIANAQRLGGLTAFIDAEHALDRVYAQRLGVALDELIFEQPDNGEDALELARELMTRVNLIVIDSVAALVPKAELEGQVGDSLPGSQARMMSQALRLITADLSKHPCCIIFINQTREKIGVKFGSPKTTSGGNSLKFYASVRMEVSRIAGVKEQEVMIGQRCKVKIIKNKLAPPYKEVEFDLIYGKGVSSVHEALDIASDLGFVTRSGSWYSMTDSVELLGPKMADMAGKRIGQGRPFAIATLEKDENFVPRIRELALERGVSVKQAETYD
jgi:recombination protein RecA